MAQRKHSFRFRIPWLLGHVTEPVFPRPKDRPKSSTKSDTNVPIQRPTPPPSPPPSRPHVITPTIVKSQPSSHFSFVSSTPKTQPHSPSHLASNGAIEVSKSEDAEENETKIVSELMQQDVEPKVKSPLISIPNSPETSSVGPSSSVSRNESTFDHPPQSSPPAFAAVIRPDASSVSRTESTSDEPPSQSPPSASGEMIRPNASSISKIESTSDKPPSKSPPPTPGEMIRPNASSVSRIESTSDQSPSKSPPPTPGEMIRPNASLVSRTESTSDLPHSQSPPPTSGEMIRSNASSVSGTELTSNQPPSQSPPPASREMITPNTSLVSRTESISDQPSQSSPRTYGEMIRPNAFSISRIESISDQLPRSPPPTFGEVIRSNAEESNLVAPPSSSQEENEKMEVEISKPVPPQEAEPKVKSPLKKTISKSPETSFQTESLSQGPKQQGSSVPSSPVSRTKSAKETALPASFASQEEKEKMVLPMSESKIKSPMKINPNSPQVSSKDESKPSQHTTVFVNEERSAKPDSAANNFKGLLETKSKLLQSEEKEKVLHEKTNVASSSRTQDKRKHMAREIVQRKMMFATSKSREKNIRVEKEAPLLQKGIKDDISKFVHKLATVVDDDNNQFSVISLAGDNRGATMQVDSSETENKEEEPIHTRQGYKAEQQEDNTEVITDGKMEKNEKDSYSSTKHYDEMGKAYINSNIQSINNSLMVHGSITEEDPGVQVILPQNPVEKIKQEDKKELKTHKSEFNISQSEMLNYQPTVHRRYLRGLSIEARNSDSDDELDQHGCKFSYSSNQEDKDIDIM